MDPNDGSIRARSVHAPIRASRFLGWFECLLGLPLLLVGFAMVRVGWREPAWDGPHGGRVTVAAGLCVVLASALVFWLPGIALFTRWRLRWWPQVVPVALLAALAAYVLMYWIDL